MGGAMGGIVSARVIQAPQASAAIPAPVRAATRYLAEARRGAPAGR